MPAPRPPDRLPGLSFVDAVAWIVPQSRRAEWRAEWRGEIAYSWSARVNPGPAARLTLLLRCLGALPDALSIRRQHGSDSMLAQDLRSAVRSIARRPGVNGLVVLTLALGIGATTAIFSVVHGVLLRQLPYPEPDRLVIVRGVPTPGGSAEKVSSATSYVNFLDYRAEGHSFQALAGFRTPGVTLTGPGTEPSHLSDAEVTAGFFRALGVAPVLGRGFLPSDEQPGAPRVVVLGDALWQRFGGTPALLGTTITLDAVPYTVVGVLPREFGFPAGAQLWRALQPGPLDTTRGTNTLAVVGRLRPGVSREAAQAELRATARRLELAFPGANSQRTVELQPMRDAVVGTVRPGLLVLLGAVGLVLLICCANVASVLLARAAAREREVAVRAALGADRWQLVRQFLTESIFLAVAGGALGVAVAYAGVRLLLAGAPVTIPRLAEIGIDAPVLAFVMVVSLATGLAFGLAPALRFARVRSFASLREGGRGTAAAGRRPVRQMLVVSEVALAVVLTVGAALLIQSLRRLQHIDPGFDPRNLVAIPIALPQASYAERSRIRTFLQEARDRVAAVPGVRAASIGFEHPLSPGWTSSYVIAGRPRPPQGHEPEARVRPVMPGYFRTVGVPLLAGRDILPTDRADAPGVVVVNEAFVRRHFAGQNPLGQRIERQAWWPEMPTSFEIVGVVADERFLGPRLGADPATYFALSQFPLPEMYVMVRTSGDAAAVLPAVRRAVWSVDPALPLDDVVNERQALEASTADLRFNASLLGLFAAVALLLSAMGIYGVLSYSVTQRTGEIGVRLALGAPRGRVLRLVVRQGMVLALLGAAIGALGAAGLTRLLSRMVYGVGVTDPRIFATVTALLLLTALLAAYLPARRASRVDPMVALRNE